jgi:hypothetical protein
LLKHLQASWYLPNFVDWHSPISVTTTEGWVDEGDMLIDFYRLLLASTVHKRVITKKAYPLT